MCHSRIALKNKTFLSNFSSNLKEVRLFYLHTLFSFSMFMYFSYSWLTSLSPFCTISGGTISLDESDKEQDEEGMSACNTGLQYRHRKQEQGRKCTFLHFWIEQQRAVLFSWLKMNFWGGDNSRCLTKFSLCYHFKI